MPRAPRIALVFALVAGLAGTLAAAKQGGTLYQRLGGKKKITAVVGQFISYAAVDPRIAHYFAGTASSGRRLLRFKKLLADQICQATGGPCKYTGMDMRTAHKGMGITDADWNALVEDLQAALDKFKIGQLEQKELLGILGPMKPDIVGQ